MRTRHLGPLVVVLLWSGAASRAEQTSVRVDGDDIVMRGCVVQNAPTGPSALHTLAWGRKDIMLAVAESPEVAATSRVFYWIDDKDALTRHVGQQVELTGELEDFEKGKVEIDRDGDYTEVELKIDGDTEKIRVPNSWLGGPVRDQEFSIAARRIDVKDVKVLGACGTF